MQRGLQKPGVSGVDFLAWFLLAATPPPATLTRSRGQRSGQKVTLWRSAQVLRTALISWAGQPAPLIKLIRPSLWLVAGPRAGLPVTGHTMGVTGWTYRLLPISQPPPQVRLMGSTSASPGPLSSHQSKPGNDQHTQRLHATTTKQLPHT